MKNKIKNITQVFLFVLIGVFLFSFLWVNIHATGFVTQSDVNRIWTGIDNKPIEGDSYPFNETDIVIRTVGFDMLYGVKRALVYYTGEVPYSVTHDDDGNAYEGFEKLPTNPNAFIRQQPANAGVYWGQFSAEEGVSLRELEEINLNGIYSLRLYALENANNSWLKIFGNIFYIVQQFFAWLMSYVIRFIIIIKNINITTIMEAIHLGDLADVVFELFVGKRDGGVFKISPFAMFAIVSFVISLVGFAISYARGSKKEKSLFSDILLVAIVGICLVLTAFLGKGVSIGTVVSDLSIQLMSSVLEDTNATAMWRTNTNGSMSTDLMYSEISLVNKQLIDMQICTQFGVKEIDELDLTPQNFGVGAINARAELQSYKILLGGQEHTVYTANNTTLQGVNENLGYYFWFADSPAESLTQDHRTIPKSSHSQSDKLSQIITYLQRCHNETQDENVKRHIENITLSFANPSSWGGGINLLMLIIIYGLLAYCLFRYALKIIKAKMMLLVATLAIPVGGLLMCTANKKLVKYGKGILGIYLVTFIRITVFALFFDLIIHIVGYLLSTNILILLITGILLFVMASFNATIDAAIEKALSSVERKIAPEARMAKAALSKYAQRKVNDGLEKQAQKQRVVGYDENGNPIYAAATTGLTSRLLRHTANALETNPANKKSHFKITREMNKKAKKEEIAAKNKINKAADDSRNRAATNAEHSVYDAEQAVKDTFRRSADGNSNAYDAYCNACEEANEAFENTVNTITDTMKADELNRCYDRLTDTFDVSRLTAEEKAIHDKLVATTTARDTFNAESRFKELRVKQSDGTLSESEATELSEMESKLHELEIQRTAYRKELSTAVQNRIEQEVSDKALETEEAQKAMYNREEANRQAWAILEKEQNTAHEEYIRAVEDAIVANEMAIEKNGAKFREKGQKAVSVDGVTTEHLYRREMLSLRLASAQRGVYDEAYMNDAMEKRMRRNAESSFRQICDKRGSGRSGKSFAKKQYERNNEELHTKKVAADITRKRDDLQKYIDTHDASRKDYRTLDSLNAKVSASQEMALDAGFDTATNKQLKRMEKFSTRSFERIDAQIQKEQTSAYKEGRGYSPDATYKDRLNNQVRVAFGNSSNQLPQEPTKPRLKDDIENTTHTTNNVNGGVMKSNPNDIFETSSKSKNENVRDSVKDNTNSNGRFKFETKAPEVKAEQQKPHTQSQAQSSEQQQTQPQPQSQSQPVPQETAKDRLSRMNNPEQQRQEIPKAMKENPFANMGQKPVETTPQPKANNPFAETPKQHPREEVKQSESTPTSKQVERTQNVPKREVETPKPSKADTLNNAIEKDKKEKKRAEKEARNEEKRRVRSGEAEMSGNRGGFIFNKDTSSSNNGNNSDNPMTAPLPFDIDE